MSGMFRTARSRLAPRKVPRATVRACHLPLVLSEKTSSTDRAKARDWRSREMCARMASSAYHTTICSVHEQSSIESGIRIDDVMHDQTASMWPVLLTTPALLDQRSGESIEPHTLPPGRHRIFSLHTRRILTSRNAGTGSVAKATEAARHVATEGLEGTPARLAITPCSPRCRTIRVFPLPPLYPAGSRAESRPRVPRVERLVANNAQTPCVNQHHLILSSEQYPSQGL